MALPFTTDTLLPVSVPPGADTLSVPFTVVSWFPAPSTTITTGCVASAIPEPAVADGTVWKVSAAGAPTPRAKLADVAAVSPVLAKPSVRAPAVPVIDSPLKLAMPLTAFTVAVPPSVPPPDAIVTVTGALDDVTRLLLASRTWITGCVWKAKALAAPAGCVTTVSLLAAPGAYVMTGLPVTMVLPLTVAEMVAVPVAVELIVVV